MSEKQLSKGKIRVYLDQNVFSHIARTPGDWRANEYASTLAKHAQYVEVWISPTHVVELTLCSDEALRRRVAEVMLSLCGGRRMTQDYGMMLASGFIAFVKARFEGSISSSSYVSYYDETLKQLFLGTLALLATGHVPNPSVVGELTRKKVENRWLRAEAGRDPSAWLKAVRNAAKKLDFSPTVRPELAKKTLDGLVDEICQFEQEAESIDMKDRVALEKERALFVRAYAVGDVYEALGATFGKLAGDLVLTFNFEAMAERWSDQHSALKCRPMPTALAPDHHALWILDELVRSLWHPENGGISAARIAQEVMFHDYAVRLNESDKERAKRLAAQGDKVPTDSLTFDADHAAIALCSMHVFATRDELLLNASKSVVKQWTKKLQWTCKPVFSPEQLNKALSSLASA